MIINHNLAANNAIRNMNTNSTAASKSMQKLSSGLRINSASDDAAGLAISEKMRGQIRGLDQATSNAQDATNLIGTAEGALNETTSIIQRMRELSVQASSDTNTADDRAAVQKEVTQLKSEIDRIGNTTEFNTTKLIDGSIGAKKAPGVDNAAVISSALGNSTAGAATASGAQAKATLATYTGTTASLTVDGANITINHAATDYTKFALVGGVDSAGFATKLQTDINDAIDVYNKTNNKTIDHVAVSTSAAVDGTISITSGSTGPASNISITSPATGVTNFWEKAVGVTAAATVGATGVAGKLDAAGAAKFDAIATTDKMNVTIDGKDISVTMTNSGGQSFSANDDMSTATTGAAALLQQDINAGITAYNATVPTANRVDAVTVSVKDGAFVVQSGSKAATSSIKFDSSSAAQLLGVANQSSATQGGGLDFQIGANSGQTMKITVADMRTAALGIDKIDMSTKEGAQSATALLDTALKTVSGQRADLGAFSNRLEHTIANLGTSSENLTSAESRIRDVDMAKEMSTFSKNNILAQAAQAMLAQANQQPQQVLQLLR
jgi:flagellin